MRLDLHYCGNGSRYADISLSDRNVEQNSHFVRDNSDIAAYIHKTVSETIYS